MKQHKRFHNNRLHRDSKKFNNKRLRRNSGNNGELTIHRAGHVMISPCQIIDNGFISVVNNTIVDVGAVTETSIIKFSATSGYHSDILNFDKYSKGSKIIDHGSGIIMPSLVNAHTHFELSALKGKIPFDRGFNQWVRELINQREQCGAELLKLEAKKAIESAILTGTSLAGEISTLGITEAIFANSDISGVWFQEYLGNEIEYLESEIASKAILLALSKTNLELSLKGVFKKIALAGHAPHTTSPALLKLLKEQTNKLKIPFSIHVAESDDETEFITTGQGNWANFLKERGIDSSSWQLLPSRSPVQYLNDIGLLDPLTLAVHLINVDDKDIEIIAKTKAKPIFCPRSNFNLHKKLPDIPRFLKHGIKPALGTDSLASTDSINMFDEMLSVATHFPQIAPSDILAMATINGANALGFGEMAGTLEKGKKADFIYVPEVSGNSVSDKIMSIIEYKSKK
ncbi:MAG: amidohydrolase family protein [Desulfamplus sp.]|nr:amidohydrolase family protein [Desulfamplus sp.]